jgi:hypothetical protein
MNAYALLCRFLSLRADFLESLRLSVCERENVCVRACCSCVCVCVCVCVFVCVRARVAVCTSLS